MNKILEKVKKDRFVSIKEGAKLSGKDEKTIRRFVKENANKPDIVKKESILGGFRHLVNLGALEERFKRIPVFTTEEKEKQIEEFLGKDIENMIVSIARGFSIYGQDLEEKVANGRSHLVSKIQYWYANKKGNKKAWTKKVLVNFYLNEQSELGKEIISYTPTKTFKEEAIYRQDLERKDIYLKPEKKEEKIPEDEQERLQEINEAQKISAYGQKGLRTDENDEEDKCTGDNLLDGENISHSNKKLILEELKKRFKEEKGFSEFKTEFIIYQKKGVSKRGTLEKLREEYGQEQYEKFLEKLEEALGEEKRVYISHTYDSSGRRREGILIIVMPTTWEQEGREKDESFLRVRQEIEEKIKAEKKELEDVCCIVEINFPETAKTIKEIINGSTYKEIWGEKKASQMSAWVREVKSILGGLLGLSFKKGSPFPQNKTNEGIWDNLSEEQKELWLKKQDIPEEVWKKWL